VVTKLLGVAVLDQLLDTLVKTVIIAGQIILLSKGLYTVLFVSRLLRYSTVQRNSSPKTVVFVKNTILECGGTPKMESPGLISYILSEFPTMISSLPEWLNYWREGLRNIRNAIGSMQKVK
jgi:hypothetical protein